MLSGLSVSRRSITVRKDLLETLRTRHARVAGSRTSRVVLGILATRTRLGGPAGRGRDRPYTGGVSLPRAPSRFKPGMAGSVPASIRPIELGPTPDPRPGRFPQYVACALYDIVLDGMSLVSSYRSQFNSIIGTSSVAQLLERMRTA